MAFDAHSNLAYSVVATAPSPAASGTSLIVTAGDGAIFPTPPFNALVWPASVAPSRANAEIIRVSGIVGDTFTIARNQEEAWGARSIIVGDQIIGAMTAKTIQDIEAALASPFGVAYGDLGAFTIADGLWKMVPRRLIGASTRRITIAGTGRLRIMD